MNTLYVRVHPKRGVSRFFRCGTWFTQAWQKLTDLDAATAKRLRAEQMLEVSATEPEGFAAEAQEPTASSTATAASPMPPTPDNQANGDEVAQRLQAIRDAIAQMDRENETLWTSSGKPKTEAITAALGWNVSAMERDAAMAQSEGQA